MRRPHELDDKKWLDAKYWTAMQSSLQIAKELSCSDSAVLSALKRLNIAVRPATNTYPELSDKNWVYQKYWIEELSSLKIAKLLGCTTRTVLLALKRHKIPLRTLSEAHADVSNENNPMWKKQHTDVTKKKISEQTLKNTKKFPLLTNREWLEGKYWKDELIYKQIADIIGCHQDDVCRAFKRLLIPARTKSEIAKGREVSEKTRQKARERRGEKHPMWGRRGDKCPMYGKHLSEDAKKKISEANSNPSEETREKIRKARRGTKHSEKSKQKMSEKQRGEKNGFYGKHHTEETKRKLREMRKHLNLPKHNTVPELIFQEICKKNNLPFQYVGNGQLWIGKRGGRKLNPDFCELNGKKVVIEIFGDYWHSPLLNKNIKKYMTLDYRKAHYRKYGWKSGFVWESDLKQKNAEDFVLSLLRREKLI